MINLVRTLESVSELDVYNITGCLSSCEKYEYQEFNKVNFWMLPSNYEHRYVYLYLFLAHVIRT